MTGGQPNRRNHLLGRLLGCLAFGVRIHTDAMMRRFFYARRHVIKVATTLRFVTA